MPAGSSYTFKEGMIPSKSFNIFEQDGIQYYSFDIKNQFIHAVHALAWFKKIEIEVDGSIIDSDHVYFILRGQWFQCTTLKTITEVYWNICEPAQFCIRPDRMLEQGLHHVKVTFYSTVLEDTQVMDTKNLWPPRVEFVEAEIKMGE